ncbi:MAG: phage minor head protein [Betaproteobacteria bacterium]
MLSLKASRRRVSVRKEWAEQNRLRNAFESRLFVSIRRVFRQIGSDVAQQIENYGPNRLNLNFEGRFSEVMIPHYRSVIESFGDRVMRERYAQKEVGQFEQLVQLFILEQGAANIQNVSGTTKANVSDALLDARDEELKLDQLARRIKDVMNGAASRRRAAVIARTETHNAASFANDEVHRQLNIPFQKQWAASTDDRTRSAHASVNGQTVGMDDFFDVGGARMKRPGDPMGGARNVINCRCVLLYIEPEDEIITTPDEPVRPAVVPVEPTQPDPSKLDLSGLIIGRVSKKRKQEYSDKLNNNLSPLALSVATKLDKPNSIKSGRGVYFSEDRAVRADLDSNTLEHEYGHHIDHMIGLKSRSNRKRYHSELDRDFQEALVADGKALGLIKDSPMGTEFSDMRSFITGDKVEDFLNRMYGELLELKDFEKKVTRGRRKGSVRRWRQTTEKFTGAGSLSDILDAMTHGLFYDKFRGFGHGSKYYYARGRAGAVYYETFANLFAINGNEKAMAFARKYFPNLIREFERILKETIDD